MTLKTSVNNKHRPQKRNNITTCTYSCCLYGVDRSQQVVMKNLHRTKLQQALKCKLLQKNIVFECSTLECTVLDKPMNHHQLIGQYRSTFYPPILIWLDKILYRCSKISAFKACGYNFYSSSYIGDLMNGLEENHLHHSKSALVSSSPFKRTQAARAHQWSQ